MGGKADKAATGTALEPRKAYAVGQVLDYGTDVNAGFEDQTRDDITIPFISVLQGLSPQLETIEGAKAGMLFNTVTNEIVKGDEGVLFVPGVREHVFVEWIPRKEGGGFVAVHQPESDVVKAAKEASEDFGKFFTPRAGTEGGKNDLVETYYVYGTLVDADLDPVCPVVLAFTSTKIKVYKRWSTLVRMFTLKGENGTKTRPPMFAHTVRLLTVKEKNAEGEYYNFNLVPANGTVGDSLLPPGHPALEAAKGVADMVKSGLAKAAYDTQQGGGEKGDPQGDGKIPF